MKGRSKMFFSRKTQSIIEYVLLIGIVTAAFVSMQGYITRAVQAHLQTLQREIAREPQ